MSINFHGNYPQHLGLKSSLQAHKAISLHLRDNRQFLLCCTLTLLQFWYSPRYAVFYFTGVNRDFHFFFGRLFFSIFQGFHFVASCFVLFFVCFFIVVFVVVVVVVLFCFALLFTERILGHLIMSL